MYVLYICILYILCIYTACILWICASFSLYIYTYLYKVYICTQIGVYIAYFTPPPTTAGSQWHKHWRFSNAALGASAAVNSILVCSICLQPRATVLLYGFVPVPAALLGILYITYDLRGLLFGGEGHGGANVGYAAHIGGALCGALFYVGLRTRRLPHVLLQ